MNRAWPLLTPQRPCLGCGPPRPRRHMRPWTRARRHRPTTPCAGASSHPTRRRSAAARPPYLARCSGAGRPCPTHSPTAARRGVPEQDCRAFPTRQRPPRRAWACTSTRPCSATRAWPSCCGRRQASGRLSRGLVLRHPVRRHVWGRTSALLRPNLALRGTRRAGRTCARAPHRCPRTRGSSWPARRRRCTGRRRARQHEADLR
mmetsp:Transcript_12885/g.38900  ORF Transcript_12885/g.38900 Transcript_12885/m.38900 type:complete len:204 (-) Transcript_12885:780-1391(-)